MKHIIFRGLNRGLQICAGWYALSFSNPLPLPPPLSEIQVINTIRWTVEVDCNQLSPPLPGPCSTDTFTLFCGIGSAPSSDAMLKCVMPEQVDSNGIALLTLQQFPNLRMIKGYTVYLGLKGKSGIGTLWSAAVPANLDSTSSIISGYSKYCCMGLPDGSCGMECSNITYVTSVCPSLGTVNTKASGTINGQVIDADGSPLNNISVHCTNTATVYNTTSSGNFYFYELDHCHTYSLSFTDINGNSISDTVIGPLSIIMGRTLSVNVHLNYKKTTAVISSEKIAASHTKIRFLQAGAGQRIVLSVLHSTPGRGAIELFSTNGKCIRTLPVDFNESGTYTVKWDGCNDQHAPVASGKYGCRVQINGKTMCSGFIIK